MHPAAGGEERLVWVEAGPVVLEGSLGLPWLEEGDAERIVVFVHGSGSSRHSPRNQYIARALRAAGLATLLFDLLIPAEEEVDVRTAHLRFDIGLLASRLAGATDWLSQHPDTRHMRIGYFGASTGGGAALVAAAERPDRVGAVVSRGGRPDLAGPALPRVQAPTLLVVGELDQPVVAMNREAMEWMQCDTELAIVPGATHLFEEPGTLEQVTRLAQGWFLEHLVHADDILTEFDSEED